MELKRFIILAVVLALTTVGAVLLVLPKAPPIPAGAQTIPYLFMIGADPGFDLPTDIFRLGQVTPGGSSSRSITIEPSITSVGQDNASVRYARVYVQGKGSQWIRVEPSVTELPGTVKFTLSPPRSAEEGSYRGTVVVVPFTPELARE